MTSKATTIPSEGPAPGSCTAIQVGTRAPHRGEQVVAGYQSRVPGDIQEGLRWCFHDLYGRASP